MAARGRNAASKPRGVPVSAPSSDSESVRIRKISNGFLISRESFKRGKFTTHEEFSPTKPVIMAGAVEKGRK